MLNQDPRPNDSKIFVFSLIVSAFKKILPAHLRRTAGEILFGVTPAIPVTLTSTLSRKAPRNAFLFGAGTAFLLCFVVILLWTMAVGSFKGNDPSYLYFSQDYTNLINYLVLVPLYVGLASALIVLSSETWIRFRLDSPLYEASGIRLPRLSIGIALFVVIGASAALTCTFISECLDPKIVEKTAWYIAHVDATGQRSLGGLGVYYALLTFSMFLICFSALVALGLIVITAAEAGRCLRSSMTTKPATFDELAENLTGFVRAYIVAKAMTGVLMLNYVTWNWINPPKPSFNVIGFGALLAVIGLFFVSFPRYYVELEWYTLSVRRAIAKGEPVPVESSDLRSRNVRLIAYALDILIISGFIQSIGWSVLRWLKG